MLDNDHNPRTLRCLPMDYRTGVRRRPPRAVLVLAVLATVAMIALWIYTYGVGVGS